MESNNEILDRLTRVEERSTAARMATDDRMARMEVMLANLAGKVEVIAGDVRDARVGLRIGFWLATVAVPVCAGAAGWVLAHIWPGK